MNSSHSDSSPSQDSGNLQQPVGNETDLFLSTVVRCAFPLLICTSFSLGWQVPALYNLSGAQQSHTPAIVGYVFGGFLIACGASILLLPLMPKLKREDPIHNPLMRPHRFHRTVITVGMIIAVVLIMGSSVFRISVLSWIGWAIIGATSFVYPILCAIRLGIISRSLRWRIAALYSCLYLPFLWVFTNNVFQGTIKQQSLQDFLRFLQLFAGAPALISSVLIGALTGAHPASVLLCPVVVSSLEVLLGLWIIQLGARRAIAYLILLLAVSVITSFGFHAVLRA